MTPTPPTVELVRDGNDYRVLMDGEEIGRVGRWRMTSRWATHPRHQRYWAWVAHMLKYQHPTVYTLQADTRKKAVEKLVEWTLEAKAEANQ